MEASHGCGVPATHADGAFLYSQQRLPRAVLQFTGGKNEDAYRLHLLTSPCGAGRPFDVAGSAPKKASLAVVAEFRTHRTPELRYTLNDASGACVGQLTTDGFRNLCSQEECDARCSRVGRPGETPRGAAKATVGAKLPRAEEA